MSHNRGLNQVSGEVGFGINDVSGLVEIHDENPSMSVSKSAGKIYGRPKTGQSYQGRPKSYGKITKYDPMGGEPTVIGSPRYNLAPEY